MVYRDRKPENLKKLIWTLGKHETTEREYSQILKLFMMFLVKNKLVSIHPAKQGQVYNKHNCEWFVFPLRQLLCD